ncbi:hypothetical protein [Sphingopyxis witflariensis]|uniref:DNA transfer protein p32 n=1 Tax=Sphingopyxis witflariensis TaxID=173675 RepID=A0A246JY49_9SPHN|nr:hypothetical protein [Sphingopyxis witflariensis]OWQ98021.1 hypothetical protein CDQ91_10400 [Sphingopyxis witflariensis]
MAIATGLAIAAGVSAAAGIGGAAIGAKAQKKAANKAAQTAADTTAANNALAADIYGQNKATLAPFVNTGTQASGAINALLGLGGPAPVVGQSPAPTYGGPVNGAGQPVQNALFRGQNGMWNGEPISDLSWSDGQQYAPQPQYAAANVTTQAAPQNQQQQYQNAFDNYRNSTGYQFRLGEGTRALDNSYASRGVGQSGAAAKAALNYGQNIASGEFGNYLNALMAQQGVGVGAASAQAGVSTNFVNQTTANNNSASSAAANAAIAQGNATGNMWSGIGNSIGGAVGNIFGSSFGGGGTNAYGLRAGQIY